MDKQHGTVVVQFNAPHLGEALSQALQASLICAKVVRFADTESDVLLEQSFHELAGKEVILVAQFGASFAAWSINDFLMMLCFLAKRIRVAGALSLRCVLPYFPYARQDIEADHGGISCANILSDMLGAAGVDLLITFDLHNPLIRTQTSLPIVNVSCTNFWADAIEKFMQAKGRHRYVLVAPDRGAVVQVQALAQKLGIEACFVAKRRTEINHATAISLSGAVEGRYALILDDIIDTGRTAIGAAELILSHGATGVSAFFTHAVLSSTSLSVMQNAPFDEINVTDSIHRTSLSYDILKFISMTPFIIDSVSKLAIQQENLVQAAYESLI